MQWNERDLKVGPSLLQNTYILICPSICGDNKRVADTYIHVHVGSVILVITEYS